MALASHQCGPGSIPRPGVYVSWVRCWFSTLLWEVFLRVLQFSPLLKNQHFQIPIRSWNAQTFLQKFLWRVYGKPGNLESGTGTGTGTGTRIGEINECFKLGSMSDIKTPPPFSAFLARWMMTRGALLSKGTSTKNIVVIILFSQIELGMMLLSSKTYLLLLVGRDNTRELWLKCDFVWKISGCTICAKPKRKNTVKTRLVFPTIDRNAEILSGGFNDRFSCCWMYWLFVNFDCRVSSWTTMPVSRGIF